ncbi:MAG: cytidine deaminase [Eubacterium sp.]|nr:cytidine deaminase [Eubacterium sp.]
MRDQEEKLLRAAAEARKQAYCPYSGYAVGAAVLTGEEDIVSGCNVENASYGLSNCGERTAIFKAVSRGAKRIKAVAITGAGEMPYPCGACRQVMAEFAESREMPVYVALVSETGEIDKIERYTLEQLLPHSFTL